ncbi:hypothetical protein WJX84_006586 [Apatococcus fuscideae]|uniref:Uncharacterized protein n=1 Tax=Apatococcus fuscideae TaxID=2026836 RepID=A0AAW1THC8_9CHLO
MAEGPDACKGAVFTCEGTASPGDTAAATYAPAPGTRQPCEIAIRLWELEQQGGATSVRVTSSARTYELYAKIHSNANGSYVASFRGKETERPGVFSVKIPLQESCGRASDASLRLLSIKDKTKLELHHFALDVPGARGGVLEAPDESEHSVPEPISWNEGLAALSPRTQSQAAQIRGMLQSALQPGGPPDGNGIRPGFARGAPPAQLMQAIARAAMGSSQAMPSLPPLAATRSMSGSTMVHPHATHSALQPTLPASSSAAPQTPAPPLSYATGTSTVFPEILPLLQSISSRLQRSDERLAHLETTLDARLQDAVRSGSAAAAEAAPPQVAGALDVTPQEGASTPAGGASPEANGHMGKSNAGVPSSMVSPFANGPGVGDAALRTQSVPSVMEGPSLGGPTPSDSPQANGPQASKLQPALTARLDSFRLELKLRGSFRDAQAEMREIGMAVREVEAKIGSMGEDAASNLDAKVGGFHDAVQGLEAKMSDVAEEAAHGLEAKMDGFNKAAAQGVTSMSTAMADLKTEFEQRLRELEEACKENGTLLRDALANQPTFLSPGQTLQSLSNQARGRPEASEAHAHSPRQSQHSRSSSADSQGSLETVVCMAAGWCQVLCFLIMAQEHLAGLADQPY